MSGINNLQCKMAWSAAWYGVVQIKISSNSGKKDLRDWLAVHEPEFLQQLIEFSAVFGKSDSIEMELSDPVQHQALHDFLTTNAQQRAQRGEQ